MAVKVVNNVKTTKAKAAKPTVEKPTKTNNTERLANINARLDAIKRKKEAREKPEAKRAPATPAEALSEEIKERKESDEDKRHEALKKAIKAADEARGVSGDEPSPPHRHWTPIGDGQKPGPHDHTTTDDQLNAILSPIPGFIGCFASDELHKAKISATHDTSLVLNSDPHDKPGTHWVAIWVSPVKDKSVELFDSLADESPLHLRQVVGQLKAMVHKLGLPYRLKFKHNGVRDQRANSSTCGWFSVHFIMDRARGKTFAEASHFKDISEAEKSLRPLEKEFRYL